MESIDEGAPPPIVRGVDINGREIQVGDRIRRPGQGRIEDWQTRYSLHQGDLGTVIKVVGHAAVTEKGTFAGRLTEVIA